MGRIRTLLLGNKEEDVELLRRKYGSPPSEFFTLPNGVKLHVRDEGHPQSPTIIFLHGHTEDLHTWNNMAKKLVENFRVIRFDLRRHGLTGPAQDNEYKLESYVSDLSLFIQHLELDNFVLVGHSMGGRISTKYTIENPEKVNGLVLLSASGAPREEKTSPPMALRMMKNPLGRALIRRMWSRKMAKGSLEDMVFDSSAITDEEVDRMWDFSRYPGNMNAMFREFAKPWEDFKPTEIEGISTNTLLIWGEEDTICPISMGEWYDSHLPNSKLVRLQNIGHNPQFECPDKCLDEITSWMN
ncbi:MAG: alpha/beta hydrolase [Candidatus Thermoplasmatota archaeon]|nr:alpha/beta hydrolase [Candidatus Thermoplasmatota archaeon]